MDAVFQLLETCEASTFLSGGPLHKRYLSSEDKKSASRGVKLCSNEEVFFSEGGIDALMTNLTKRF